MRVGDKASCDAPLISRASFVDLKRAVRRVSKGFKEIESIIGGEAKNEAQEGILYLYAAIGILEKYVDGDGNEDAASPIARLGNFR